MKLSIVIPIYNAAAYLKECLSSIVDEIDESSEIEVLLIDDGSKDESYNLCKRYECSYVHIFQHENHGVSYTRNFGIKNASGDKIMFVDADDRLKRGWVGDIEEALLQESDVIYFSKEAKQRTYTKKELVDGALGFASSAALSGITSPCSKIFNRNFLMTEGIFFNENLINGEDALLNLCVIIQASTYAFFNRSFYQYRIHEKSSTRNYNKKFYDSNMKYLRLMEDLLRNVNYISGEEREKYIARAFMYSIYLQVYLISTISEKGAQVTALQQLESNDVHRYMERCRGKASQRKIENIVYSLVEHKRYAEALRFMRVINFARWIRKRETRWVTI